MKKSLLSLAVGATISVAALSAQADDMYRGAWYAVPGATVINTDGDLDADDNGFGGFLKIGKELSEHWDIQGGFGRTRTAQDLGVAGASGSYKQTTLGLDALYMFSRDKFRPFLLAGLGAARNDVDYSAPGTELGDKKTSWLANVGLGAQVLFTDSFGMQMDLRSQWSRAKMSFDNGVISQSDTETVRNTLFNLGGIFRFGAPTPMPVVEAAPEPMPVVAALPEIAPYDEEPLPPLMACQPTMETITLDAEELFGFDKARIKEGGRATLDDAAQKINANPDLDVVLVTGHTDKIGSAAYNQKLSERRANMVKDYLVTKGVDSSRLKAIGKGETMPVVECTGVRGKALIKCLQPNRRVELSAEKTREVGCQ